MSKVDEEQVALVHDRDGLDLREESKEIADMVKFADWAIAARAPRNRKYLVCVVLAFFMFVVTFVFSFLTSPIATGKLQAPEDLDKGFEDLSLEEQEDELSVVFSKQDPTVATRKTVFWNNTRVVIVTGVEGTGYEEFNTALQDLCFLHDQGTTAQGKSVSCDTVCELQDRELWFPPTPIFHNRRVHEAQLAFRRIRSRVENGRGSPGTIHFLNLFNQDCPNPLIHGGDSRKYVNNMLFPSSGKKPWTAEAIPDLHWLATLAERERVDLRIVTLLKSGDVVQRAREIFRKVRTWDTFATAKAVESFYQSMNSQLIQVSPEFVTGVDLELLGKSDKGAGGFTGAAAGLDDFVGVPGLTAALRKQAFKYVAEIERRKGEMATPEKDKGVLSYTPELNIARDQLEATVRGHALPVVSKTIGLEQGPKRPKMLFFAGLEGTGHHLWFEVTTKLMRRKELLPACDVSKVLFGNRNKQTMWWTRDSNSYEVALGELRVELQKIVKKDKQHGKTYLANLLQDQNYCQYKNGQGMMSYPNYGSRYKLVQRPNLITLARECEAAGIDLQIIMLVRDGQNVIRSTADNRGFGAGKGKKALLSEISMLTASAHILYSQLEALDPKFRIFCFDQDDHSLPGLETLGAKTNLASLAALTRKSVAFPDQQNDPKRIKILAEKRKKRASLAFSLTTTMAKMRQFCPDADTI